MTSKTKRVLSYRDAINEALKQEMESNPDIILMGEDIAGAAGKADQGFVDAWGGPFRTTQGLIQQFGEERVRDTPISEAAFIGAAIGAAAAGVRTVAELMYFDFIGVCLDQLLNNAAKMHYMYGGNVTLPFTLLTRIGAGVGSAAQHSEILYSLMAHIPGLKGVVPSDAYTAKGLLTAALRSNDPVIFFEHKLLYHEQCEVPEESYELPIGQARTVREGTDITLVGISKMTGVCLEAAELLSAEGINAEVVDLLSVFPIDYDHIIASIQKTHRMVIVDEDTPTCSVAADIAATVGEEAFDSLDAPIMRVQAPHTPVPYARELELAYIPDALRVVKTVREVFGS